MRVGLRALFALVTSFWMYVSAAGEPPAVPFLRIETGHHAALVRRLVVAEGGRTLVTAGDDKTVRIWQLPEGRLSQTLRLPMADQQEGRPFAVAVTPDGRDVYVGGWTGWDWDGKASVYRFEVASGNLVGRYPGFASTVTTLNLSPDRKVIAVGVGGQGAMEFRRVADASVAGADNQFNQRVMAADYAQDGRLAAVALDGYVRMYDRESRLIGRQNLGQGAQPVGVRFSPDGGRLVISFRDRPRLAILSATDFSVVREVDVSAVSPKAVFAQVAWSSDGSRVMVTGDAGTGGEGLIWRWGDGGAGKLEIVKVGNGRVADMAQMPDGRLAFSTEDPAVGVLDAAGQRSLFVASPVADFRGSGVALKVSADGGTVEFPLLGKTARFSLKDRRLELAPAPNATLLPPRREVSAVKVEKWLDSEGTLINGQPVTLDPYETTRSYAVSPEGSDIVLGTEWTLRLNDRSARQRWATPLVSPAWNVTFSGDGSFVIATLGDGTVRWYRREDGAEVMALFAHGEGQEWIAWLPSGYYVSSDYGDNFIGWLLNRGKDRAPDFFRAVQFERLLFRPDMVRAKFAARGGDVMVAKGLDSFDVSALAAIAPPRIRVNAAAEGGKLKLRLNAEDSALPLENFAVYVNNIPVIPAAQRQLSASERARLQRDLEFPLFETSNVVRVEVFNGKAMGLAEQYVEQKSAPAGRRAPGDLYLLAVGVNHFEHLQDADLGFAARDAEQVGKRFARELGRQFRNTHVKVISDLTEAKPVRANVIQALDFIKPARAEDTVMIFLASHGMSDDAGNYYFVPRDTRPEDVKNLNKVAPDQIRSMISWTVFSDALRSAAGRRLLVVDTCHSGNMAGTFDLHSLSKRSAASLFSLISAAKGDELSQEYDEGEQGLFTYSMLSSLNDKATDRNGDGFISVNEMFGATAPLVNRLRDKTNPQTPQMMAADPLGEIAIATLPDNVAPGRLPQAKENLGCGTRTLAIGRREAGCLPP